MHILHCLVSTNHATVCMPSFKPNHGLLLMFPLLLHDGGSGLRLYDGSDVKL